MRGLMPPLQGARVESCRLAHTTSIMTHAVPPCCRCVGAVLVFYPAHHNTLVPARQPISE